MSLGAPFSSSAGRRAPLLVRSFPWFVGYAVQVGWLVVGLASCVLWVFTPWSDVHGFRGPLDTAPAYVDSHWKTDVSVDGAMTWGFAYHFTGPDHIMYIGKSYGKEDVAGIGWGAVAEFVPGDPAVSRLRGARLWIPLPPDTLPVAACGLAALVFAVGVVRGIGPRRLMRRGAVAEGRIVSKEWKGWYEKAVDVLIAQHPILYRIAVRYRTAEGEDRDVLCRTYEPEELASPKRIQVLYDPRRPGRAMVLQGLPGLPYVDETGRVRLRSAARAARRLAIPTAAITLLASYLIWRYVV